MKPEEFELYLTNRKASVVDALQKIDKNSKGLLFVINEEFILEGVITDGDIRRWLIRTGELHGAVENFMNTQPCVMHNKNIDDAIKIMDEKKITALPVVDDDGKLYDIII